MKPKKKVETKKKKTFLENRVPKGIYEVQNSTGWKGTTVEVSSYTPHTPWKDGTGMVPVKILKRPNGKKDNVGLEMDFHFTELIKTLRIIALEMKLIGNRPELEAILSKIDPKKRKELERLISLVNNQQ